MSGLILSRKKGQQILIHDNGEILITVTVLDTGKVSVLRIESNPKDFDVDRLEVYNSKYGDAS